MINRENRTQTIYDDFEGASQESKSTSIQSYINVIFLLIFIDRGIIRYDVMKFEIISG